MGSPSTFRAGRPASVLVAIGLLGIAYWLGLVPGDATRRSPSDIDRPVAAEVADPAQQPGSPSATEADPKTSPVDATGESVDRISSNELLHGILRQVSGREYLSPSGLIYGPGSAEGHRLSHLERHTQDDPRRSGSHGVFDGGMRGALSTIDLAYERARSGQGTATQQDGDRTIFTVDMGKRVGYVGGSEGQRRGHPTARRVRLVLEGNHVVTAFPL